MQGSGTPHGAAGSALGYLYQSYLPLLQLAQRADSEPGLVLRMELLDDVQFDEGGTAKELLQSKHHVGSASDLTDTSVDLWRTLNVWLTAIAELEPDELPILTMITTSEAAEGSAASHLRPGPARDPNRAVELLRSAALTSVNKQTERWRNRFSQLTSAEHRALVNAITVIDSSASIDHLDEELTQALRWVVPLGAEQRIAFINHVKGWWLGTAIRLLRRDLPAFAATDMLAAVQDIREQYSKDHLPTDPDLPDPDLTHVAEYEERAFVQQLKWIAVSEQQLAVAIRDCYRAFTQRSRWLRRELVGIDELDRYEERLVDEWRFVFTNLTAELAEDSDDNGKTKCGRDIFVRAAETAKARIRERYEETFMTRGSLHLLADNLRIGWHPEFEARIEGLLIGVVEEP
jgi:hypothetical protein